MFNVQPEKISRARFDRHRFIALTLTLAFIFGAFMTTRAQQTQPVNINVVSVEPASELPRADDPSGEQTGVPDYVLETLKGKDLRLSSLRGKIVLLDFFSAACPHCQKHAPVIAALAKKYRDRNLVVVSLCAHNPYLDRELVEKYAQNAGIENDVVWSPYELFTRYMQLSPEGIPGVPQMVLFDKSGRVVARFMGWDEKNPLQIEEAILKALK
jgi:thiol-disulfide isomerase/thioredoxin